MMNRRLALSAAFVSLAAALSVHAADYPTHSIEIIVPFNAGGGTDALARAFADNARKHLAQPFVVNNKPGASGVIGWSDVVNAKPDGYKLALMTVELTILPHLGLAKFGTDEFAPIARLNYDPAAITVKGDAPWNTVEEFIAAAKKANGEMKVGNSGNGSIWHLAAASVEDKTGAKFSHIPYPGAAPAVLSLLGGHIDAVAVSPAEVAPYLAAGKLKMLGVMADQRLKAFEKVPTLKERGIDVSIGAWRGLGAPKGTPKDVLDVLKIVTQKTMAEPAMREAMDKLALGYSYGDDVAFKATMDRNNANFKALVPKLNLKP
ncbi:MAG: tripartite tricarboxylate transporter substrate binding protein [Pseudomonadota bacterium]